MTWSQWSYLPGDLKDFMERNERKNRKSCMFCGERFEHSHPKFGDTRFDYNILGFCGPCIEKVYAIWHGRHSGNYLQFNKPRPLQRKRKNISKQMALRVFARSEYKCIQCGSRENLCVDHIVPFSKGGECKFENYQTLCWRCNSRKKDG